MSDPTKKIERVSLDLETTGDTPGCCILSIGACTFNRKEVFYRRISHEDSLRYLKDDIETMRWWSKQDAEVRAEAFGGTISMISALDDFSQWFKSLNEGDTKNVQLWCRGSDFDGPILKYAYKAVDRKIPWDMRAGRCLRTLEDLLPHVKAPLRASKRHNAVDDAIYQAEHASVLLAVL